MAKWYVSLSVVSSGVAPIRQVDKNIISPVDHQGRSQLCLESGNSGYNVGNPVGQIKSRTNNSLTDQDRHGAGEHYRYPDMRHAIQR